MKSRPFHRYQDRLQSVLDRLARALENGEALPDLEQLAAIAHFSPFHFHRIWRSLTGETIGGTVLRLRLRLAIGMLANPQATVTDVAHAVGFGSSQAFAKVTRQHLDTTPGALLADADLRAAATERLNLSMAPKSESAPGAVEVMSLSPFRALLLPVTGDNEAMAAAFGALFGWAAAADCVESIIGLWSIEHDDRRDVPAAECRADAMVQLEADIAQPLGAGMEWVVQDGGRYARLRVTGSYELLEPAVDRLLRDWLPESGESLAERPILFQYLDDPETTPEALLRTDIHLPLMS